MTELEEGRARSIGTINEAVASNQTSLASIVQQFGTELHKALQEGREDAIRIIAKRSEDALKQIRAAADQTGFYAVDKARKAIETATEEAIALVRAAGHRAQKNPKS